MTILYVMIHFIVERSMGMREPRAVPLIPDSRGQWSAKTFWKKHGLAKTWRKCMGKSSLSKILRSLDFILKATRSLGGL